MPSRSKAPRGLFVLQSTGRIFTAISISPDQWSRQLPSRYTFRARRNLPDKVLRYLRTVIVTAAVHPGLSSSLFRKRGISHPLNLRALGRRQPPYIPLRVERRPVFLLNSRLCIVAATLSLSIGNPFSRSYRANLQSSSRKVCSLALAYLASPPVSVCGTDST